MMNGRWRMLHASRGGRRPRKGLGSPRPFTLGGRFHALHRLKCCCRRLSVAKVDFFWVKNLALMRLGKVRLQAAVSIEAPLASITLEFDICDLGSVIFVVWMKLLEMSLGVELKSKDGRTQVTLVGFDLFRSWITPWRRWVLQVHHQARRREKWKTNSFSMAQGHSSRSNFRAKGLILVLPNSSLGLLCDVDAKIPKSKQLFGSGTKPASHKRSDNISVSSWPERAFSTNLECYLFKRAPPKNRQVSETLVIAIFTISMSLKNKARFAQVKVL